MQILRLRLIFEILFDSYYSLDHYCNLKHPQGAVFLCKNILYHDHQSTVFMWSSMQDPGHTPSKLLAFHPET